MRYKNSKYSFNCNKEIKEEFKLYCKISGVSPSEILQAVMIEFNDNARRISNMQDITELRALLQEKMDLANNEIQQAVDHSALEE